MVNGKVKFYNQVKQFGFIIVDDGSEVFFHVSGLVDPNEERTLFKDNPVEFELVDGKKGKKAVRIKKIGRR